MLVSRALFTYPIGYPVKESPTGTPNTAPVERDALFPKPSSQYLLKFAVNGIPPAPVSSTGPYRENHALLQNLLQPIS